MKKFKSHSAVKDNIHDGRNRLIGVQNIPITRTTHLYSLNQEQILEYVPTQPSANNENTIIKMNRPFFKIVKKALMNTILCVSVFMTLIPHVRASSVSTLSSTLSNTLSINNFRISQEMKSILIKGFISGACINLAKNVLLHPIETGASILSYFLFVLCIHILNRNENNYYKYFSIRHMNENNSIYVRK